MIDVRDSYFQHDPFVFVPLPSPTLPIVTSLQFSASSSFHVFNGVESFPIQQCGWNSGWIKDCFGLNILNRIGTKNIICSGVSAGTTDLVIYYLSLMHDIVVGGGIGINSSSSNNVVHISNQFPGCERNGVDQGVHNVLIHLGAIDRKYIKQWTQSDGPVANMQARLHTIDSSSSMTTSKDAAATVEVSLRIKNRAGKEVAVVHQYDRYPELQKHLFKHVLIIS